MSEDTKIEEPVETVDTTETETQPDFFMEEDKPGLPESVQKVYDEKMGNEPVDPGTETNLADGDETSTTDETTDDDTSIDQNTEAYQPSSLELQMAQMLGMSEQEVANQGANLEGFIQGQMTVYTDQQQQQAPQVPEQFTVDLPEDIDPDIKDQMQKMNEFYANQSKLQNEQIQSLQGQAGDVSELQDNQEAVRLERMMISELSNQDEVVQSSLGIVEGRWPEPGTPEDGKVDTLINNYEILSLGYSQSGQQVSEQAILQQALNMTLADERNTHQRKKVEQKVVKRSGQMIERPQGSNDGGKLTGDPEKDGKIRFVQQAQKVDPDYRPSKSFLDGEKDVFL